MASKVRGKKNEYGLYMEIPPMPGTLCQIRKNNKIVFSDDQIKWLRKYYPCTPAAIIMQMSGLKRGTLCRNVKILGIKRTHAQRQAIQTWTVNTKAKPTNEKNGWYKYLHEVRGMGKQCTQRRDELFAQGWNPIQHIRDTEPERYKILMQQRSETKKEQFRKEMQRRDYGLTRKTNLHIPSTPFSRTDTHLRYEMKKRGYILGDMREEMGERWIIYYDKDTERKPILEEHAKKQGFNIQILTD